MTNLENVKNGQIPKNKLNFLNPVGSKQENHNLKLKTAITVEFQFSRKRKHSFIADTNLQLTKLIEKWRQSSISHYSFKNQIF